MSSCQLNNDQIQEIESAFCFFDKDKDGMLNLRDATNALRSLGKDPTDNQLKDTLKAVNCKNFNQIDFVTFIQLAAIEINESSVSVSTVHEAFRVFDRHDDGQISARELRNVLCNLGEQMSDDMADFLFEEAGINTSSSIDYKKLIDSMKTTLKE